MLRLALTFILLLLAFVGTAVWLLDLGPPSLQTEPPTRQRSNDGKSAAKSETQELEDALRPAQRSSDDAPSFDIARITPNGTSVFAGRAEPHSLVTVTADGNEVGTVQADENGEWTLTTDTPIANPDAKLALFKAAPGAVPRVVGAEPPRKQAAPPPKTAGAVASGMLKSLEGMVAAARSGEEKPASAAATAPAAVIGDHLPSAAASVPGAARGTSVPVPITFVFNEATLTPDGRRAAGLLLEYMQLKHFPKVTLTGHADERGSDELNMGLSRERLETVARFLRDGGFKGQLDLVPKGKSEPYSGVVRSGFSQEDLWQLDRRVELIVSR